MKKYKLGPKETFSHAGTFFRAHRVIALIDIPAHDVKVGDTGGWVASRRNLAHDGKCWIGESAVVADYCRVRDDALVTGNATLTGVVDVSGDSIVKDNALLHGIITVKDKAVISGSTEIIAPDYIDAIKGFEISENARIMGKPKIKGRGFVKGSALIKGEPKITHIEMSGNSIVSGSPSIHVCILEDAAQIFDYAEVWTATLRGNSRVYGHSSIFTSDYFTQLKDNVRVYGRCRIFGANGYPATTLSDDVSVYGSATIKEGCQVSGTSDISGEAFLQESCIISGNSKISGPAPLPPSYIANGLVQDSSGMTLRGNSTGNPVTRAGSNFTNSSPNKTNANYIGAYGASPISSALKRQSPAPVVKTEDATPAAKSIEPIRLELAEIVAKVEQDYDTYKNDVVKLIKYPTMVDLKDELTLNFTFALRKAKREISFGQNAEKMEESVETLERAFLAAESNAQKIGPSNYSDQEVKKTNTAKQMLSVALDEDASENERRISFKQAFKILEGIIAVPDTAIETMKQRVGLKELEA